MGGVMVVRNDACVTNETGWERLDRIVRARMDHLGLTQAGVERAGGPSPAWMSKLKHETGEPGRRRPAFLRKLDAALGWPEGTSLSIVQDDRSDWLPESLADEERERVEGRWELSLIEGRDEITELLHAVEARLRSLPANDADAVMRRIYRAIRDVTGP